MSHPSSAWRALVWKDFQQVKSALLLMTLGILAFQLIALIGWKMIPEQQNVNPLILQLTFCFMTPIVAIMACVGLLIGQERQTGSWAWSSSLPQSWRQALASKVCVGLGASLLTVIPLVIVPAILWFLGYRIELNDRADLIWIPSAALLLMLELGVFLSVAVLIFRDSLTGLIVGGVLTTIVQFGLASAGDYYFTRFMGINLEERLHARSHLIIFTLQVGVLLLLGCAALLWLFRWRWSYGQSTEITWRRRRARLSVATVPNANPIVARRSPPRSEFWMLLSHSFRSSLFLRLTIFAGAVAFLAIHYREQLGMSSATALGLVTLVAVALFGVTTFDADHTLRRYRFFADRGVTTWRFVTARSIPAMAACGLLTALGTIYAAMTSEQWELEQAAFMLWFVLPSALIALCGAFLIGALSSLCFDRVVFSLAVTLMTILGITIPGNVVAQSDFYLHDVSPGWYVVGAWCAAPLSVLLGVASLYWLAPKWLIQDTPRLPRYLAWIMPTLVLLPFGLPMVFGFLFLPNVTWQGIDIESQTRPMIDAHFATALLAIEQPALVERVATEASLAQAIPIRIQDAAAISGSLDRSNEYFLREWWDVKNEEQVSAWLTELSDTLNEEVAVAKGEADTTISGVMSPRLDQAGKRIAELISTTAYLGDLLARRDQLELAKRAWGINKRLQEIAIVDQDVPLEFLAQRLSAFTFDHMLGKLTAEQLAQLGTESEIRATLLPDSGLASSQARMAIRTRASKLLQELRNTPLDWSFHQYSELPWPTKIVPTLRWRQERSLALELQLALAAIDADQIREPIPLALLSETYLAWRALRYARAPLDARLSQLMSDNP